MEKRKVVLFLNHEPGCQILQYLHANDEILRIYVDDIDSNAKDKIIAYAQEHNIAYYAAININNKDHISELKSMSIDFIICVHWPYLLKKEVFSLAKLGRVNFHPALLPVNRGWFPHVHSIIDGSVAGVTLHEIDEGADTGSIWVQEEVSIEPYDTASTLYLRLQNKMVSLFKDNWNKIKTLQINPQPQDERYANYHKKKEINDLDLINIDDTMLAKDLINILRARTFGRRGFAYFLHNNEKIYMNLRLSNTSLFPDEVV